MEMLNAFRYYTYLIGWSDSDLWYYGVRYAKDCNPNDLWTTYFTSSRFVKDFRARFGEPDVVQVRRLFNDQDKARQWEAKVCRRLNVKGSPKWLNRHNGDGKFMCKGHTEETRIKLSIANKGRKVSDEAKERIGALNRGKNLSAETRQKLSKSRKGKPSPTKGIPMSEEQRAKMRRTYEFISPTGEILFIDNLKDFCLNHNLSYEGMKRTANGYYFDHKGYTSNPPKMRPENHTSSKTWRFIFNNEIVLIVDLKRFCMLHSLSYAAMKKVAHGKQADYNGYRRVE